MNDIVLSRIQLDLEINLNILSSTVHYAPLNILSYVNKSDPDPPGHTNLLWLHIPRLTDVLQSQACLEDYEFHSGKVFALVK